MPLLPLACLADLIVPCVAGWLLAGVMVHHAQAADASARRHEQLVAENQKLERDYERFRRRRNLQERVAVSELLLMRLQRVVVSIPQLGCWCLNRWGSSWHECAHCCSHGMIWQQLQLGSRLRGVCCSFAQQLHAASAGTVCLVSACSQGQGLLMWQTWETCRLQQVTLAWRRSAWPTHACMVWALVANAEECMRNC